MGPGNLKILNKFIIALILLGGFFVTLKSVEAAPGINKQINFQGKVTNSDGTNVATGNYNFNFRIYTVSSGGAAVWSELTKSLTVTDGIFQTNLGDATALPGSVDFNSDNIYLGIEFNGNGEMNPRVQFTATPYAFNSDTLDGKDWTNPGTIGTSATTLALASNGTSAWTNTSGNLTISTATSGTLAVTSAGALNLTGSGASYFNTTSGNLNLEVAGTGTANVQIGDGGATSATPDLLVLDIGSAEPTGTNGAMYYSTNLNKFRCFQNAGWADCIGAGGSQTPWAQDISAAGYDLGSLSNLGFQETTGAPTGTDVGLYRDNSGDLTANVLTGKTLNFAVNGTDEFNFSSTGLAFNSNNITGLGTNLTATAGLTIAATGANALNLTGGAASAWNIGANALTITSSNFNTTGTGINSTAIGATTASTGAFSTLSSTGATNLATAGASNVTIATTGTGTVAIGNASGTFALASSGGLNVSTGGALTGVASIDTIGVTATGLTFAGTGAINSTTTGLSLNSGNNILTIDSSDTSLTASGVTTLTLGAGVSITNASGNIGLQAAGTGTANIQIGDGGATSATPDLLVLDIGSAEPTGTNGAMYYSTNLNKFRCFQNAGWADCIGAGGSQTPWAQDISAAGYDLGSLSNLGFQETTGAPTGTDVGLYRDNSGDLTANVLTGKTLNFAVNGTDEFNFSSTGLAFNSNDITGLGANLTAAGALTIASASASGLTLNSGTTGAISIGDDGSAETITIGTGAAAKTLTIGSTNTTSTTNIQSGSGGINIKANNGSTGTVQIGTGGAGSTTPDVFALDVKSNTGDPTGFEGAMYYNTTDNVFRCYQNTAWTNCIGSGGSVDLSSFTLAGIAIDDTVPFTDISNSNTNSKVTLEDAQWEQRKRLPNKGFNFYTDFIQETSATATDNALSETISGTAAAVTQQAVNGTGRVGLARATTGSTATGRAALSTGLTAVAFNGGSWFYETMVNVTTLSTATERYQLAIGFRDTMTAANQVDGIYFLYDEGGVSTGSTAAAYWQTATVQNSTRTFNTSLTQTTVTAGAWVRLGIEVNAAGTSVTFYIDGTAVSTHTANIPVGTTRATGFGAHIIKSVGTTARTVDFDYVNVVADWTTAR